MKHEIMKEIRNAETIQDVKKAVCKAMTEKINGRISEEALDAILTYAETITKSLTI